MGKVSKMKILVPGNKTKLIKNKLFECKNCGCVFIADQTEYYNCSNQHDGVAYRAVCPTCNRNAWNYTEDCVDSIEEVSY